MEISTAFLFLLVIGIVGASLFLSFRSTQRLEAGLHELASALTTAVLDPRADRWAVEQGFGIAEGLRWQWNLNKGQLTERSTSDIDLMLSDLKPIWARVVTQHSA